MSDFQLGPGPLTPEFEQVKSDIGIVENGNTATHAIPAGYYVIWKGDLYVAKTDISSGTAFSAASGGNLTAKTQGIGADLVALKDKVDSYDIGQVTVSSFETSLMSYISNLTKNGDKKSILVNISGSSGVFIQQRYNGLITRQSLSHYTVLLCGTNNHLVIGHYYTSNNGVWDWRLINERVVIPSGSDLDNYKTEGEYYILDAVASTLGVENMPVSNGAGVAGVILRVQVQDGNNVIQIWTHFNAGVPYMYLRRSYRGGTFGKWYSVNMTAVN